MGEGREVRGRGTECVHVLGGGPALGGTEGRVLVRSTRSRGCSLRTFPPPTLPAKGVGSWGAGGHPEGDGREDPMCQRHLWEARSASLCFGPESCDWSREEPRVGGRDQERRPAGGMRASAPSPGRALHRASLPSGCSPFAVPNCTASATRH